MPEQHAESGTARRTDDPPETFDDWDEEGEDEVPSVVLYVIAGLLILSFTLYLVVGGGHNHFH